jgi:hypothetical protein
VRGVTFSISAVTLGNPTPPSLLVRNHAPLINSGPAVQLSRGDRIPSERLRAINRTLINPEDDVHSFVLPDFAVSLPGNKTTTATYVARHAGIFPILCAVKSHLPMMSGQLVVLPAATMAGAD